MRANIKLFHGRIVLANRFLQRGSAGEFSKREQHEKMTATLC
jgi:hypothetical protein